MVLLKKERTESKQEQVKILYVDNTDTFGGAIISLRHLLKGINKKQYKPVVVSGQSKDYLENSFPGCTIYSFRVKLPWRISPFYRFILSLPGFGSGNLRKVVGLIRFIWWRVFVFLPEALRYKKIGRKHGVSIVHLNNSFDGQLPALWAAKMLRLPVVAHLRDFLTVSDSNRRYVRLVDRHIAISSAVKDNLLEMGAKPEDISLVFDGIDMDEFDTKKDIPELSKKPDIKDQEKRFGIFGRVIAWKGIKEFVIAASKVFLHIPDARAFIVGGVSDGDTEYLQEVKTLVKKAGIADRVVFTGYVEDVTSVMKLMDLVVLASIRPEPFGMVVIEAMAMGKPVVATKAGGPLDTVVDGETGLLVALRDTEQMSQAIIKILSSDDLAGEMGRKGRKRAEEVFCKERYSREVEQIYSSLLQSDTAN